MLSGIPASSFEIHPSNRDFLPGGDLATVLTAQLQNTIPFLFDGDFGGVRLTDTRPFLRELVDAAADSTRARLPADLFRLSLAAHWASVGSFVPVDIENGIRFRFWHSATSGETVREMAESVVEAYGWDSTALSRRWIAAPHSRLILSAHHGEWFAVAVAAYAATREADPMLSMRIRELVEFEVTRHAKIYLEFRKVRDGEGLALAASLVTQNLAELDRAIEGWNLAGDDALAEFAYRANQADGARSARFGGALAEAGRVYRTLMAAENHRHFALRGPRALRRSPESLLPLAPFFDGWGRNLATQAAIRPDDLGAIVTALVTGWERLKGPEGKVITDAYPRAVAGILETLPGGMGALALYLPAEVERHLRSGLFRSLVGVSETRFREQLAAKALGLVH